MHRTWRAWALGAAVVAGAVVPGPAAAQGEALRLVDGAGAAGLASTSLTWSASAVDHDRDGRQDVWIGRHDQGGTLWRGDGLGHYRRVARDAWPVLNAQGINIDRHECAWADVDGNGLPDAYCTVGRTLEDHVKRGIGNELWLQGPVGTFQDRGEALGLAELCGRSQHAAFLDLGRDGRPDLVVGNAPARPIRVDPCDDPAAGLPSENSHVYRNTRGAGLVARPLLPPGSWGSGALHVADVDADGWQDLLMVQTATVSVFRGRPDGSLVDATTRYGLTGVPAEDLATGDLDRDGDLDLVLLTDSAVTLRLWTCTGYGAPRLLAGLTAGQAVALGDADGDHRTDVLVVNGDQARRTNPPDLLLLNRPGLTFTRVTGPAAGGIGDAVVALDGDGDGRSEFLVLNGRGTAPGPVQLLRLTG